MLEASAAPQERFATDDFIRLENISKRFGRIQANDKISVSFHLGEIHALLGENGAGKSTLIKILAGIYRPDDGAIFVGGEPVSIDSPLDARRLGISIVHQRLELIPMLSVLDNIALQETGLGRINRGALAKLAREVAEQLGFSLDVNAKVESLSVGARQRAEIVRALLAGGRLVVLDEPTSILAPTESDALFDLLRGLADRGSAVVFVTHRLKEAVAHSHRVTVLRNGRVVGEFGPEDDVHEHELVGLMVGDLVPASREKARPSVAASRDVLVMDGVSGTAPSGVQLNDVSLAIRGGEILGIAGVEGNGQAELAALAVGEWKAQTGTVELMGHPLDSYSGGERARLIADIPETVGLALAAELSVWENLNLRTMAWEVPPSIRTRAGLRRRAEKGVSAFDIRTSSVDTPVSMLSGGNQQRVVVARELSEHPRLVVACYATRGLDVRSAAQVKQWTRDLAQQGVGVLFFSSDLEELFEISDRIAVIFHGRIMRILDRGETTIGEVGQYMVGGGDVVSASAE
jgi:ABC-type uncharacterized transport system ATPase subunit